MRTKKILAKFSNPKNPGIETFKTPNSIIPVLKSGVPRDSCQLFPITLIFAVFTTQVTHSSNCKDKNLLMLLYWNAFFAFCYLSKAPVCG